MLSTGGIGADPPGKPLPPSRVRPAGERPIAVDTVQLQPLLDSPRPEIQSLARAALKAPDLAAQAVQTATLQVAALGGPLPRMLARVALEAMKAQPDLPTRAAIGKTYLEELGANPVRLATLEDPQAAQTYQTTLLSYLEAPAENKQATRQKLNPEASPAENLHDYANGRVNRFWLGLVGGHEGHREDRLSKQAKAVSQQLWKELVQTDPQVSAFHQAARDTRTRDRIGLEPLRPLLDRVDQLSSHDQLGALLGALHRQGIDALMQPNLYPQPDGGARLRLSPRSGDLVRVQEDSKFLSFAETLFRAEGTGDAAARAERVQAVGRHLLGADTSSNYDPTTRRYDSVTFELPGYGTEVMSNHPQHLPSLLERIGQVPLEDLKEFLRYSILNEFAPDLTTEVARACQKSNHRIGFYPDNRPEAQTRNHLRPRVEQAYADRVATPEKREKARQVFEDVRGAFRRRLESAPWLSEEGKREALAKLDAMRLEVGCPESGFPAIQAELKPDGHLDNVLAVKREEAARLFADQHPDWQWDGARTEKPNAYYVPARNSIMVSAAYLLDSSLEKDAEPAELYGCFAYVLGHEMAHAFEGSGTRHDSQGRLRDWLPPQDRQFFEMRLQGVARQLQQHEPVFNPNGNGPSFINEAAADLTGLSVAYDAFLERNQERSTREGHTPEQRFFLHFATKYSRRDDAPHVRDPDEDHPGNEFRTNVTVQNMPAFAAAFALAPGSAMALDQAQRAGLW